MRQFRITIILFVFIASNISRLFATAQFPDILVYKGDTLSLFANPLEQLFKDDSIAPKFFRDKEGCNSTACWRGYQANWELINNELYLTGIYSCCYYKDSIKADLKALFEEKYHNGKVKADWFTGTIIVPKGKLTYYVHMGYESLYEKELALKIKNGILIGTKIYDNSKSKQSIYGRDGDKLREFIYSSINWNKVPKLEGKGIRVIVQFSANKKGIVDKAKIFRTAQPQPLLEKEAIRVIKRIPEWDIFYRHGKYVRVPWTFPIYFNEANREQYKPNNR
jgi:hypothetical protein